MHSFYKLDKKAIRATQKAQKAAYKARVAVRESMEQHKETCDDKKCQAACVPRYAHGKCMPKGCLCIGPMAPSYALPSYLKTDKY